MTLKLHGHPQLDEYIDPSKYPSLGVHMNWGPGENPVRSPIGSDNVFDIVALRLGNSALGHMHLNLPKVPLYAEVAGPITLPFSVVVFNAQGEAFIDPASQSGVRDIIFNDPVTGAPLPPGIRPTMRADLGVEKTYTGTLTFDPTIDQQFKTLHGWWNPNFNGKFEFDNGDHIEKELWPSFFSMVDPTIAESDGVPFVSARISPHSDRRHSDFTEEWGQQIIETKRGTVQWLPVRPLKPGEVHRVTIAMAGYGATGLPPSINELRRDSKIHEHGAGIVDQSIEIDGKVFMDCVFEADKLGPGTHPYIAGRRQVGLPHSDGSVDGSVVQMTLNVPVEGVVPPPPPPMPTTVTVPDVVGLTETAARAALTAAMLKTGVVETSPDATPAGLVFRQVPAAGTTASMDSAVDLDVSSGPVVEPPGEVVGTIEKRTIDGVTVYCICVGDQCIKLP